MYLANSSHSMIELKLDTDTFFEWERHSQTETDVPHYQALLDFLDLRSQASEVSCASLKKPTPFHKKTISKVAAHPAFQDANGAPLKDYTMTRVTFRVSASYFAANMAIKQNAIDHAGEFPVASEVVHKSFYVDDCLTGAQDSTSALKLQQRLMKLLSLGGFVLRKWNSNDLSILKEIPEDLRDSHESHTFTEDNKYSKTLGIEWNVASDRLCINM